MIDADEGMAPGRDADQAGVIDLLQLFWIETQLHGSGGFHLARLGDLGQQGGHGIRVAVIQGETLPGLGRLAPGAQAALVQTAVDGQQLQIGAVGPGVEKDLGGAHGGAPGLGRQHALAVVGEEEGVDQLGLAAGELTGEGQGDAIGLQFALTVGQGGVQGRGGQTITLQPVAVAAQLGIEFGFPRGIGIDVAEQAFHRGLP